MRLGFLTCEAAFGDGLSKALDDLAGHAAEDPLGAVANERLGLMAAFGVKNVRGFPELVQDVQEVEHERDVLEGLDHASLQRAFAVGDDHPGPLVLGVAADHLGLDVVDERVLAGGEARPYPLAVRLGTLGTINLGVSLKQAVDHLGRGAHDRRLAVDGGDGRHPFLVGLLALASAHDPQRALGLDHRDALAVDRADEYLPSGGSIASPMRAA